MACSLPVARVRARRCWSSIFEFRMWCDVLKKVPGCLLATMFSADVGLAQSLDANADAEGGAYRFDGAYTAEAWRNTSGGQRTGAAYLGNVDLSLSIDGNLAWGVPGLEAFLYVLGNHGDRLSERYVGDAMVASNIDAPDALRLYEAWLQWRSGAKGAFSVRFGLYDLNSEFDTSETRSLFIHSSHGVGHDLAQTGLNGPSIFPVTSLGMRAAWAPSEHWTWRAAVFDGVPGDPDDPTRTRIHLSQDEGALAITELEWSSERVRELSLGYWSYTSDFADVRADGSREYPPRRGNAGAYVSLEVALGSLDGAAAPPASAFVRYGLANGRINEFDRFLAVGGSYRGVFRREGDDEIGLAYAHASTSSETRSATGPRARYEGAIELTYRVPITDWFVLQPDLQYIVNPGADSQLEDSFLIGLRAEFSWGFAR